MGAVRAVSRYMGEGVFALAPVRLPQGCAAGEGGFLLDMLVGQVFDKA